MSIQQSLEKWQKEVGDCAIFISELTGAVESVVHSMTAFEYQSKPMPRMYSQPEQVRTGFEHAFGDLDMSARFINRLEDEEIIHISPGVGEAYANLARLAQDKKWDESIMEPAYSKIIEFLVYYAPKQVAEKCILPVVESGNPGKRPDDDLPMTPAQASAMAKALRILDIKEPIEQQPWTRGEAGRYIRELYARVEAERK